VNRSVLDPYCAKARNCLVVRNSAPLWFAGEPLPRPSSGLMRVMHGKALGSNGTSVVLDALAKVRRTTDAVEVVMTTPPVAGGNGSAARRSGDLHSRVADGVRLEPGIPHEQMPKMLSSCEVGMIAYGRRLGEDSLPNRLFEYMAAGLAVLAPSYAKEISGIVLGEGIGVTADFEDPADVARGLLWLVAHPAERHAMGVRARKAFLERHNWSLDFAELAKAIGRLPDGTEGESSFGTRASGR
jgi:glycosyltransferase involved in cell wall biosynthesis